MTKQATPRSAPELLITTPTTGQLSSAQLSAAHQPPIRHHVDRRHGQDPPQLRGLRGRHAQAADQHTAARGAAMPRKCALRTFQPPPSTVSMWTNALAVAAIASPGDLHRQRAPCLAHELHLPPLLSVLVTPRHHHDHKPRLAQDHQHRRQPQRLPPRPRL